MSKRTGQQHHWGQGEKAFFCHLCSPTFPLLSSCPSLAGQSYLPACGPKCSLGIRVIRRQPSPSPAQPGRPDQNYLSVPRKTMPRTFLTATPGLTSKFVPRSGPLPAGVTVPLAQCQGHRLPGAPRLARRSPRPICAQRGGQQGWRVVCVCVCV
jgi:hypothetical protein